MSNALSPASQPWVLLGQNLGALLSKMATAGDSLTVQTCGGQFDAMSSNLLN